MRRCMGVLIAVACLWGHSLSDLDAGGKRKLFKGADCGGCATPYPNCSGMTCAGPVYGGCWGCSAPINCSGCSAPTCAGFGCSAPTCGLPQCAQPLNYGCAMNGTYGCAANETWGGAVGRPEYAPYIYTPRPVYGMPISQMRPDYYQPVAPMQATIPGVPAAEDVAW